MRPRALYQTMALIALAYVLFSSKAHGQTPTGCPPLPKPVATRVEWSDGGCAEYGMTRAEAKRYRAELVGQALAALINRGNFDAGNRSHRRELGAYATLVADDTLVAMGVLKVVLVEPAPAEPEAAK